MDFCVKGLKVHPCESRGFFYSFMLMYEPHHNNRRMLNTLVLGAIVLAVLALLARVF